MQAKLGDIAYNLAHCEQVAAQAGSAGAQWIVLPEYFTTGIGFTHELCNKSLPENGPATDFMLSMARRFHARVGGSFLCLDRDGETRNSFFLVGPQGVIGHHDKDIPTLWENCWYIGGTDAGRLDLDGLTLGIALCAEFGRTATVRHLRGVDQVVGSSFTWHAPDYFPRWAGRTQLDRHFRAGPAACRTETGRRHCTCCPVQRKSAFEGGTWPG